MAGEKNDAIASSAHAACRLVDAVVDAIWLTDVDGRIIHVVKEFRHFARNDLVGLTLDKLLPCEDGDSFEAKLRAQPWSDDSSVQCETALTRLDGAVVPIELTIVPRYEDADVRSFFVSVKDLSQQKKTETSLRRSELLLWNALNLTKSAPWEFDPATMLFTFNDPFYAIFGSTADAVGGYQMSPEAFLQRFVHPDDWQMVVDEIKTVLEPSMENHGRALEHRILYADGSVGDMAVNYRVLRDSNGNMIRNFGVNRDITLEKRAQRIKEEFVSVVTHELRTPLTSILGGLALMRAGAYGEMPQLAARTLDVAYSNSKRLARLIDDVLDLDKLNAGNFAFNIAPARLKDLVEKAAELNEGLAQQRDITILVPPVADDLVIDTDPDRLQQVLGNLLNNAIKFSAAGQTVSMKVDASGEIARISIVDHGSGVPESFRTRIFESFAQADPSDSRQAGGTGLGLSTSKAIVERLGGTLGYHSEPGIETVFHVEFPLHASTRRDALPLARDDGDSGLRAAGAPAASSSSCSAG